MDKRSAVRRLAEKIARDLAEKIARDLFTEGGTPPRVATRLVMEHAGRLGAGWCERAVADRIEDHLRVALTERLAEALRMATVPAPEPPRRDGEEP